MKLHPLRTPQLLPFRHREPSLLLQFEQGRIHPQFLRSAVGDDVLHHSITSAQPPKILLQDFSSQFLFIRKTPATIPKILPLLFHDFPDMVAFQRILIQQFPGLFTPEFHLFNIFPTIFPLETSHNSLLRINRHIWEVRQCFDITTKVYHRTRFTVSEISPGFLLPVKPVFSHRSHLLTKNKRLCLLTVFSPPKRLLV